MSREVLTNDEIAAIQKRAEIVRERIGPFGYANRDAAIYFAREIESATLSKTSRPLYGIDEATCRERERVAVRNIVQRLIEKAALSMREGANAIDLMDAHYPSLNPEPRFITLSTGQTFRPGDGTDWEVQRYDGAWCPITYPPCVTVSDFEACAALLREVHGP